MPNRIFLKKKKKKKEQQQQQQQQQQQNNIINLTSAESVQKVGKVKVYVEYHLDRIYEDCDNVLEIMSKNAT